MMSETSLSKADPAFLCVGSASSKKTVAVMLPAVLCCSLAVALGTLALVGYRGSMDKAAAPVGQTYLAGFRGKDDPVPKQLASQYSDADGDMQADPPTDPSELLNPDTLVFGHYVGDDEGKPRVNWKTFQTHLAEATGKKVALLEYMHTAAEVAAVAAGEIQLVALHSADVPCLVNGAGLNPVAVLGTKEGANGNHLVIAVASDSKFKTLDDLRGNILTCTQPDSITGFRAAVTTLFEEAKMRPDVDYYISYSHGQERSIRGLIKGQFDIAAISNDTFQKLLAEEKITQSDCRLIYESKEIPRLAIGYINRLEPELAAKVTAAVLSFKNDGADSDGMNAAPLRFVRITYKNYFSFVRKMDDLFDPRCGPAIVARLNQ